MLVQPDIFPQSEAIIVVVIGVVMDSCWFIDQGDCCWHRHYMVMGSTKAANKFQKRERSHKKNTYRTTSCGPPFHYSSRPHLCLSIVIQAHRTSVVVISKI